jgi:hypothetical protein
VVKNDVVNYILWLPIIVSFILSQQGLGMASGPCSDLPLLNSSWYYFWNPTDIPNCNSEFVPMIWGSGDIGKALSGNNPYLLGFNEPDVASQASLSPALAATLWRQVETLYPNRLLVSPAVMNINWLYEWYNSYISIYNRPPRVNAIAVHVYRASVADAKAAVIEAEQLAISWGLVDMSGRANVWITEYAFLPCTTWVGVGNMDNAVSAGAEFTSWLKARGHRYAWFTNRDDYKWFGADCDTSLVSNTGQLTPLGIMYRDVQ